MNATDTIMLHHTAERKAVRLHLTNIVGLGAVRLLQSLLPSLVALNNCRLEEVFLPASGELSTFTFFDEGTICTRYKRYLPNSISRLLECTLFGSKFDGATPLLVFGDIPLKCKSKQTVFVQTPLLIPGASTGRHLGSVKYWVARWLFRQNMGRVSKFIVQTENMKLALGKFYPEIKDRIHVIGQPAPHWLIGSKLQRTGFDKRTELGVRLFYPAATYPHKNHSLLTTINHSEKWPVAELILTIPDNLNPNRVVSWIRCVGELEPEAVLNAYATADALLFLSLSESYGFPLIEAIWIGLPIICPDLPYARTLCGEQAIYFDPHKKTSLYRAIVELTKRRDAGWWPDWSAQLEKIPANWQIVADSMLQLATAGENPD